MPADARVTAVVLTHNRVGVLARTLQRLSELPERPRIIVVDNASDDGTVAHLAPRFAHVEWVRRERNAGAAGRNAGAARVRTRYIAFSDDDMWWAPGSLRRAADLLDAHPWAAAIAARVLVGPQQQVHPACERMAGSPLRDRGLPGPALLGFMAGAVVMRRRAFQQAGGYEPRLHLGAEDLLLALDLASLGWSMAYADTVVAHHDPPPARHAREREVATLRNRVWIAWLRLPATLAWRATLAAWHEARALQLRRRVLQAVARGLWWVLPLRRVVPLPVTQMWQQVHAMPDVPAGALAAAPRADS